MYNNLAGGSRAREARDFARIIGWSEIYSAAEREA